MSLDVRDAAPAGPLEPTLVADLVALAAARDGGRDALVEASGRRLTWADLDREVDRVATGLGDVGHGGRAAGAAGAWATASSW